MDLRAYYQQIREIETSIEDDFPIIKSLATEDGGKSGRFIEVPRALAARMIVDGGAELATLSEAQAVRANAEEERQKEEKRRQAAQVQFTVISDEDLKALQKSPRSARKG